MKNKKTLTQLLLLGVLLVLFVILVNPHWLPFVSDATKEAIAATVRQTFGGITGDAGAFSAPKLIAAAAVILLVLLLSGIIRFIIEKSTLRGRRSRTVAGLILSVVKYASVLVVFIWGLSILGVNVAGIFASLGIVSLIIGFGAQSLIEDIITGIFIIFEGQYNVGDIIILDDFRGEVSKIGVRTTCITDAGGNIKIVNNSDIRNLQNRSDNLSVAISDIGISYGTRIEAVEQVLSTGLPAIAKEYPDLFPKGLTYKGVQELGASAVVLRVIGYTKEVTIFDAQRTLNRALKILFDDNGIEVPFQQVVLHNGDSRKEK